MTTPEIQAYIDKMVATWPPLTEEQVTRVAMLLRPDLAHLPIPEDSATRKAKQALTDAEAQLSKVRQSMEDAMVGCRGCGLTRQVHGYQRNHGLGFHNFEPMSADETIATIKAYKPKLAKAEKALTAAQGRVNI